MRAIITSYRYYFAIWLQFVLLPALGQITYYVSANGSDSNDGLSVSSPYQSVTKVNQLNLHAGDKVLFRRGDIFRGGLTIFKSGSANSPITFDAYGTGNKPIISGSVIISNWVMTGENTWQAVCIECGDSMTGLYDNDNPLPLGRYPNLEDYNKGYMTVQSHVGASQLMSKETLTNNWAGGEVVVRPQQWILDRAKITQQEGNTLTLNNNSSYGITDGWGYFIQNHPATLDKHGEWYYNPTNKTIQLYYTKGNPNTHNITAAVIGEVITTYNQSYITIQNIHITGSANIGFYAATTNHLILKQVDITNSGIDGVQINGTGVDIILESVLIYNTNNNAFQIQQYNQFIFRNNVIRNAGLIPGRGKSGDGQYIGFNSYCEQSVLIENNRIDSIGYTAVAVAHNNIIVQNNVISNFCLTKSDGGGIYVYNGNNLPMNNIHFLNNILYNAVGASEGSIYTTYSGANGIYIDDCGKNVEIKGNTIFDCTGLGILLHGTTNITVDGNTSINNMEGQFVLAHNNGYCPARNNTVQNNIFVGTTIKQSIARYESIDSDLTDYGSFDNNYYVRPFDDVVKIGVGYKEYNFNVAVNGDRSLAEWQNLYNKDLNSKNSPITLKDYIINNLNGVYKLNSTFNTNNDGWYPYSYYTNGRAIWENTGHLNSGDLQIDFSPTSGHTGSYAFIFTGVGPINHNKSYILRFNAVASAANKSIQVFLRQRNGTYTDLTPRYSMEVGTAPQSYEVGFITPAEENDAIIIFKIAEDGKVLWLDNISLQEADLSPIDTNKYILLVYNPTSKDSTINIAGRYRDIKNNIYNRTVTLLPFTSLILFRETIASTDLDLSLLTDKQAIKVGEIITLTLGIHNGGSIGPCQAIWTFRLPSNVEIVNANGLTVINRTISGSVQQLSVFSDTLFTFKVKVLTEGIYRLSAQISSANLPDPDSNLGSGVADGEDDSAIVELRTVTPNGNLFVSPNINQRSLPIIISTQSVSDITKADLSLFIQVSKLDPLINTVVSFTLTIINEGGAAASNIQVQNRLPNGLQFIEGTAWVNNANTLSANISSIPAGSTVSLSFQARVISNGTWINNAQIASATPLDSDSTPGNGFSSGEDDETQIRVRVP